MSLNVIICLYVFLRLHYIGMKNTQEIYIPIFADVVMNYRTKYLK